MSRSKRLFLVTLVLSSIINANNISLRTLNEQMHRIENRVSLYFKCLRGKCLPEERTSIEQKILFDGAILISSLIALGTGIFLIQKYAQSKKPHNQEPQPSIIKPQPDKFQEAQAAFYKAHDEYNQAMKEYKELEASKLLTAAELRIAFKRVQDAAQKRKTALLQTEEAINEQEKIKK